MNARRVLLRLPSWLGDFVLAEPIVRALDAARLERLVLWAPERFFELFAGRFERAERVDASAAPPRGLDLALFLDGSLRSVLRAIRAGARERTAWSTGGRGLLLTRAIAPARERGGVPLGLARAGRFPRRLPRPFTEACCELAHLAGCEVRERTPLLLASEGGERAARARGAWVDEPFVLLAAGGRAESAKALSADLLARAAHTLEESFPDRRIVLVCGPGEEARAREALRGSSRRLALVDPCVGLAELVALAARATLFVGADGGLRHVCAAAGAPCVVLFGPTDPRHTASGLAPHAALVGRAPCAPCHLERCPLGGGEHQRCFAAIDGGASLAEAALATARRGA